MKKSTLTNIAFWFWVATPFIALFYIAGLLWLLSINPLEDDIIGYLILGCMFFATIVFMSFCFHDRNN